MYRNLITLSLLFFVNTAYAISDVSVWLYNQSKNEPVLGTKMAQIRPIASITKIMTAIVSLDHDPDVERLIKMPGGGHVPPGLRTRREVLTAMLVRSDNLAAEIIASDYPGGRKEFLKAMNKKAQDLQMTSTKFQDPSGLNRNNVSTAGEVGLMIMASTAYPFIVETSIKKQAAFEQHFKKRVRTIMIHNTNAPLLFEFDNIIVSKTGFTNPAGWCVGLAVEKNNQKYIVVILGAKSKKERFDLAKELLYNHLQDIELEKLDNRDEPRGITDRIRKFFDEKNLL